MWRKVVVATKKNGVSVAVLKKIRNFVLENT